MGVLPTMRKSDLGLDGMVPSPRYQQLNKILTALRGGNFGCTINGLDELIIQHDSVMLEACNSSFQFHLQVSPAEFARSVFPIPAAETGVARGETCTRSPGHHPRSLVRRGGRRSLSVEFGRARLTRQHAFGPDAPEIRVGVCNALAEPVPDESIKRSHEKNDD